MSERYWQRSARSVPRAAVLLAAAGTAAITGCGSAAGNGATNNGTAGSGSASGTTTAGMAGAAGIRYSAAQMRSALLTSVNGVRPAAPAESGAYGTLPDVQTSKQSMQGVAVKPAKCAEATVTGFNSASFVTSPASVVTFRVGRDGVSEVLVATSPANGIQALAATLPSECAHYHATVSGRTFAYTIKEMAVHGVADQAHAVNVKAIGYPDVDVWSVVFRSSDFVGAVTIVGPDASEPGAKVLAKAAFTRAAGSLH